LIIENLFVVSKIGEKPILIPEGVDIKIQGRSIQVRGEKGSLSLAIPEGIKVEEQGNQLVVSRGNNSQQTKALHGTIRQLINNMVTGVQKEWVKKLKIVGTGYNASLSDGNLILNLGLSHPVTISLLEGIRFEVEKDIVCVMGCDRAQVGKIAAEIRNLRLPDVYKGKGIRYLDEVIKLKPGKAAKTGEGIGESIAKS